MTQSRLDLSLALSDNPNTRPLLEGRVEADGIRLTPTAIHPSEMFWRQLKFAEFDVSEMSMSSLLIATSKGPTPWVALPVFTTLSKLADSAITAKAPPGSIEVGIRMSGP